MNNSKRPVIALLAAPNSSAAVLYGLYDVLFATGAVYAVTGNIGKLFQIGPAMEKDGVLESEVMDASWFAEWGRLAPKATGAVKFETRSGNLDRPQKNWSNWTPFAGRIASHRPGSFDRRRAGDGADALGRRLR